MLTDKELSDIRRKMLELEEEPPTHGWKKIEADIRPWWRWRILWAIVAGGLLLGTGGIYLVQQQPFIKEVGSDFGATTEKQEALQAVEKADRPLDQVAQPGERVQETYAADVQQQNALVEEATSTVNLATQPHLQGEASTGKGNSTATGIESAADLLPFAVVNTAGASKGVQPEKQQQDAFVDIAITERTGTSTGNLAGKQSLPLENSVQQRATASLLPKEASSGSAAVSGGKEEPVGNNIAMTKAPAGQKGLVGNSITTTQSDSLGNTTEHRTSPTTTTTKEQLIAAEKELLVSGTEAVNERDNVVSSAATSAKNAQGTSTTITSEAPIPSKPEQLPTILRRPAALLLAEGRILVDSLPVTPQVDKENQEELPVVPVKEGRENEWSLGLFFTPRYTFRSFTPRGEDAILITGLSNKNQWGRDRIGYVLGASVSRSLSPRLQLESSLSFMKLRENISYTATDGTVDSLQRSTNSLGEVELTPVYITEQRQLISAYAYGGFQLGATYYFWQNASRRFSLAAGGGVNLLLKGRTDVYSRGELVETVAFPSANNLLEQINYDVQLGIGYNLSLYQKYEFTLMPTLNYYLGSTFSEREPFGLRSYTVGLKVQLRRCFVR